ncbi:hypothetical protein OH491_07665 [Termitidicoccus mucosus]|uniref:hypothetical protein n=1 Tax=Termitidicoccus mucosus TaxID=1184151 RepID=UPI0011AB66F4
MAQKPPPLPGDILNRVILVASVDGRLLLITLGALAVMFAMGGNIAGALVCVLAAGTGAMELHGASLLGGGDSRGIGWLVRAQLLLMALILFFTGWQLTHYDPAFYAAHSDEMFERLPGWYKKMLDNNGMTRADLPMLLKAGYMMFFTTVGCLTIAYQGLLALYYHRRRIPIEIALGEAEDAEEHAE